VVGKFLLRSPWFLSLIQLGVWIWSSQKQLSLDAVGKTNIRLQGYTMKIKTVNREKKDSKKYLVLSENILEKFNTKH
jgi:hypothetical protein